MNALAAAAWGALGAVSLVVGAWLALRFRPADRIVGLILGFGAGALLGAVAYELVPKGEGQGAWSYLWLGAGALAFFAADRAITGRHRADAAAANTSIVLGALLDGIPESVVLGMSLAAGGQISWRSPRGRC